METGPARRPLALRRLDSALDVSLSDRQAHVLFAGLLVAAIAVYGALGAAFPAPFVLVDELIHGELARSLADGGWFRVRGESIFVSYLYPAVIAPPWLAGSAGTSYALAKLVNALSMSLAAVPVYFWGRRLCSAAWALGAAALTLCLPWLLLTGTLMTENLFFPLFVLALWLIARAVEEPTHARVGLVLVTIVLATTTRLQGLVLLPVLAASAVLFARFERRRVRLRPYTSIAVAVVIAAAAYTATKLVTGSSFTELGVYAGVRQTDYSVGGQLRWLVYNLGELVLATGVAPAIALAVLVSSKPAAAARATRAFCAVAVSAVCCLAVLAAFASSWEPLGVKERYTFYAAPLLFLALAAWIDRPAHRPLVATVAGGVACTILVAALPLARLVREPAVDGNALGLIPFRRLGQALPGGMTTTRLLVVVGAATVGAALVLLGARWTPLLGVAVGAFLVLSSFPIFASLRNRAEELRDLAALPANESWLDGAIGRDGRALFLNTSNFEPESRVGLEVRSFEPVWMTELWNRSLRGVISLGRQEPSPLAQRSTTLDWSTGRVAGVRASHVVARPRFPVDGRLLARAGDLQLWRVEGPVRLTAATEGVFADGRMNGLAAYSRWRAGGRRVVVRLARGPARVRIGRLAALPAGGARISKATDARRVGPGGPVRLVLDAPAAPFRVEVRAGTTTVSFLVRG